MMSVRLENSLLDGYWRGEIGTTLSQRLHDGDYDSATLRHIPNGQRKTQLSQSAFT